MFPFNRRWAAFCCSGINTYSNRKESKKLLLVLRPKWMNQSPPSTLSLDSCPLYTSTPPSWPWVLWAFCEADRYQWEWGSQRQCWEYTSGGSGRDQNELMSALEGSPLLGWVTRPWKAARPVGQSLIGKQQRFVSTAIYVSRAWQAVSTSEGR